MSKVESKDMSDGSAADMRSLASLLLQSEGKRISSAQYLDKKIWIKRYDIEKTPLAKRLHALITPLLPFSFLKSSKIVSPTQMAEREQSKLASFRQAGKLADNQAGAAYSFIVPTIIYSDDRCLVMEDASSINQTMLNALRKTQPDAHGELLDFFEKDDRPGFLDFEEEPEAVMPLVAVQARDLWLLFFQISAQALKPETTQQAFYAYQKIAPAEIIPELEKIIRFFRFTIKPLRFFKRFYLGGDGKRLLKAMEFFDHSLKS